MKEESIYFHGGIYHFSFPYIGGLDRNEENEVEVYHCDVELRVGQEDDMKQGKLVTVIITEREGSVGIQDKIQFIATKIRIAFFDSIFIEKHWQKPKVPEHQIRWIERHLFSKAPYSTMEDEINEVSMIWDVKKHAYHSPSWTKVENVWK